MQGLSFAERRVVFTAESVVSKSKPEPLPGKAASDGARLFKSPHNELLIGATLCVAASLSFWMTRSPNGIALLWPGTAIAAALLIRLPQVRWRVAIPSVLLALLLTNVLVGHRAWGVAALFAGINGAEIALMVLAFRFILVFPYPQISISQAAILTTLLGIVIPGLSAVAAALLLHDPLAVSTAQGTLQLWSSHAIGACLLAPPILLFSVQELKRLSRQEFLIENTVTFVVSLAGCYLTIRHVRFPFVSIGLILLIASFRLGAFGTSLLSLAFGLLIANLWLIGIRPVGLDPVASLSTSLIGLPVIALLATVMPPIAVGLGSDARRLAVRALRDSETRYRLVVEDQTELISLADLGGDLVFVNKAYAAMFGREADMMIGTSLYDYLQSEDRAAVHRHLQAVLNSATPISNENWMIAADGGLRWISWTNRTTYDAQGRPTGIHSVGRDKTQRRLAEQALRDSERRLTLVTDNFPGLISQLDCQLRYLMVNRRYADWFQIEPATLIGKSLREFYGDAVYSGIEGALTRALGGTTVIDERQIVVAGVARHCQVALIPQRNDAGVVIGLFAIHTDITERRRAELALRESQSFLARTGAAAGVGGWELNLVTGKLTWSDETRRLHEVDPEFEPTVDDGIRFYTELSRPLIQQALQEATERATPWDLELELVSAKGRLFWARATGTVEFENGKAVRLVGAFQDVTEKRRLEQELADSYELVRVTLESIGDAVITTDREGRVQWLNPVAESMTGWTKSEARAKPLTEVFNIVHAQSRQPNINPVAICLEEGRTVGLQSHSTLLSRTGAEFGVEDSTSPIRNAEGAILGAVLVFHDVTEQRRLSHEMSHRAAHDALTGLVNRAEFEVRLSRLLSGLTFEGTTHVLMYIDLDEFKVVNDACGHSAGDQLLRQVSVLLQGCVRGRDTVARLGGDEFGVLLENCGLEHGQLIAQKMCDQMQSYRFAHDGRRYRVGTSIGVVPVDLRWGSSAAVMQAADSSCYAAKDGGRNRVHVWVESDRALQARQGEMQWVNRLEAALDENRFALYAQHIEPIGGPDGRLHCEVLLRLIDDDGAVIAPGAFLPSAERFHLASRIDRWVVQHVFARLQDEGIALDGIETIAINLSGQSLGDRAFHRDLVRMLRAASFDVRKLCFEITETAAITNLGDAKIFIDEIRALGVRVALDDFGAGASSFGYLRTLPVDYIKIDGQFITGLLEDPLDNAAVRCFCEVAKVVGVKTIAEFVESAAIRAALQNIGVDYAQGYLIHRAEPLSILLPEKCAAVTMAS